MSRILRVLAVIAFVLATVQAQVLPGVPLLPLGLALWCGSTLVP